jgi:hypothetical protein
MAVYGSATKSMTTAMKGFLVFCVLATVCVEGTIAQQKLIHYLSGTDKDHTVEWDFFVTKGHNSGKWMKIPVPSNWELQGFGNYNYGQDENKSDEQGLYKYSFTADPVWKGKRIFIVFEGVMTDADVRINGRSAGPIHQGGYYRFKYDVTRLIRFNRENLLEVTVSKASSNPSVNRAERDGDYWALGGIFRPVYLEIVPNVFIDRVAIDARADGSFHMEVYGVNMTSRHKVTARISDLQGNPLGSAFSTTGSSESTLVLSNKFTNPALWNPESPNLYEVEVSVEGPQGRIYSMKRRFGFRTVDVKAGDGIYVNGRRVILKGVNRHSFWPESGRTLSRQVHLNDIALIRDMNMNAVRMSHYPPDSEFLDLCDSLGLFVLDELGGWQAAYDTEVGEKLVRELVIRDVNHPCIILWNNGNERGWNTDLDDDFAKYDPQQRVVLHPIQRFNGFDTRHYPEYEYVVNSALYEHEIYLPTEFMHGLHDGGHAAGLEDFWELMLRHPSCAGGFLWSLVDEGLYRTDKGGVLDVNGNKAPDGIVGPHREKEASYFAVKEIWSPVYIAMKRIPVSFDGAIPVENRYIYTNLDACTFSWKLVSFPQPSDRDAHNNWRTDALGSAAPLSLSPGERGTLKLDLPRTWENSDALFLTARGPDGGEVCTWSWPIRSAAEMARDPVSTENDGPIQVARDGSMLIVKQGAVQFRFDTLTGSLSRVTLKGAEVSLSGPELAGQENRLREFKHYANGNSYVVEPVFEGEGGFAVKWTFTPGRPVRLQYQYLYRDAADFMGIVFDYPEENLAAVTWLGRGPYRVWKNRLRGQQFGVWRKEYNSTITGESWDYPEFKGYHADLYWARFETRDIPFTIYTSTPGIFLQLLRPDRPAGADNDNTHPPFPEESIGFLHAISPIGTKFQKAEVMGPSGGKNIMLNNTPFRGELWIDFWQ